LDIAFSFRHDKARLQGGAGHGLCGLAVVPRGLPVFGGQVRVVQSNEGGAGLDDARLARLVAAGEVIRDGPGAGTVRAAHPVSSVESSSSGSSRARYTDARLTPRTLAMAMAVTS